MNYMILYNWATNYYLISFRKMSVSEEDKNVTYVLV